MPNTARELLDYTRSLFPPGPSATRKSYSVMQAKERDKKAKTKLKEQFDAAIANVEKTPDAQMLAVPPTPKAIQPEFSLADRVGRTLGRVLGGDPLGGIDEAINYKNIKRGEAAQFNDTMYDQWLERQAKVGDINESRANQNKARRTTILDAIDKKGDLPSDLSIETEAAELRGIHQDNEYQPMQLSGTLAQQMAAATASLAQGRAADRSNLPKAIPPEQLEMWRQQGAYYKAGAALRDAQTIAADANSGFQHAILEAFRNETHRRALVKELQARIDNTKAYLLQLPGTNAEAIGVMTDIARSEQQLERLGTTKNFDEFLQIIVNMQDTLGVKLVGPEQNPLMQLLNQAGGMPAAPPPAQ